MCGDWQPNRKYVRKGVEVKLGEQAPAKEGDEGATAGAAAPGIVNPFEYDISSMEDKPWRKPGADLTDWFNYGFNEETWQAYCQKQVELRRRNAMQASIQVVETDRSKQEAAGAGGGGGGAGGPPAGAGGAFGAGGAGNFPGGGRGPPPGMPGMLGGAGGGHMFGVGDGMGSRGPSDLSPRGGPGGAMAGHGRDGRDGGMGPPHAGGGRPRRILCGNQFTGIYQVISRIF